MKRVGIVMGTKPATSFNFWVQVDKDRSLSVNDIVKVTCDIPEYGTVHFYGVVENVEKGFEGLEFDSWNSEAVSGVVPFEKYHMALVTITRIVTSTNKDIFIPPDPGSVVYLVEEEDENKKAINMDTKENLLPAGILNNGEVCYINWDFVNGTKGAHISISGISGVATKTSYALFLIHSMFYSNKLSPEEKRKIKVLIFNVKGEDLLHIDKHNKNFDKTHEALYRKLGIEPKPFDEKDVTFFSPPRKDDFDVPWSDERKGGIKVFSWSLKDFFIKGLMKYMFDPSDVDDNFYFVLTHFSKRMREFAKNSPEGARVEVEIGNKKFNIDSLYKEDEDIEKVMAKVKRGEPVDISLTTLLDLYTLREDEDENLKFKGVLFPSSASSATISKFIRKFSNVSRSIYYMIKGAESRRVSFSKNEGPEAIVVNISDTILNNYAQRFVVGAVLSDILNMDEDKAGYLDKVKGYVFIMLDELNKYAPSEGESPLKNLLVDISERGRSLGIVLIGAQQMVSQVEPRIVSNCSIKVNGRVDSGELESKYYKYLPPTFKEKAKKIASGTMMLYQPDVEVPLVITFPYPPYATRAQEVKSSEEVKKYNNLGLL
jgi:DNA helicase HerA-like ATPase